MCPHFWMHRGDHISRTLCLGASPERGSKISAVLDSGMLLSCVPPPTAGLKQGWWVPCLSEMQPTLWPRDRVHLFWSRIRSGLAKATHGSNFWKTKNKTLSDLQAHTAPQKTSPSLLKSHLKANSSPDLFFLPQTSCSSFERHLKINYAFFIKYNYDKKNKIQSTREYIKYWVCMEHPNKNPFQCFNEKLQLPLEEYFLISGFILEMIT